jgi:hypothetical protein
MKKKDVSQRIREFARDLVQQAGFEEPPVCPYSIAARNGVLVREEYLVNSRTAYAVRQESLNAWLITLHSSDSPEGRGWQLAVKLMEVLFPRRDDEIIPERVYEVGASELLLPTDLFNSLCSLYNYDLLVLRQRFGNVSMETLGRRILGMTPAVLTVVDQGRLTLREASEGLFYSKRPTTQEMEAIWIAYDRSRPVVSDGIDYNVKAWPVLSGGGGRVVALSFPK